MLKYRHIFLSIKFKTFFFVVSVFSKIHSQLPSNNAPSLYIISEEEKIHPHGASLYG